MTTKDLPWSCTAIVRVRVGKKERSVLCGMESTKERCTTCGAPRRTSVTSAGDYLKEGDTVHTPAGLHRNVTGFSPQGEVLLTLDRPHDSRELRRLFPLFRKEDLSVQRDKSYALLKHEAEQDKAEGKDAEEPHLLT
jgi:hypothetical protein